MDLQCQELTEMEFPCMEVCPASPLTRNLFLDFLQTNSQATFLPNLISRLLLNISNNQDNQSNNSSISSLLNNFNSLDSLNNNSNSRDSLNNNSNSPDSLLNN